MTGNTKGTCGQKTNASEMLQLVYPVFSYSFLLMLLIRLINITRTFIFTVTRVSLCLKVIRYGLTVTVITSFVKVIVIQCEFHSKTDSTIKPSNKIHCQFHSKTDTTIKRTNRIQCEFNSITDLTIKPTNWIQCQFHSKMDSTIKPSNKIQCEFHSKTDSTIKPTNRIQCHFHSKTNPGFNVNSVQ